MATASIPVDLFNPGHVFACLGLVEAADVLLGDAQGGFDWSDESDVRFLFHAKGETHPVHTILDFLFACSVESKTPSGSDLKTDKWGVATRRMNSDDPFPFPAPTSPATLPVILSVETRSVVSELTIDYWGDNTKKTGRDNTKFWAGAAGYPGAALTRDALDLIRDRLSNAVDNPFDVGVGQSSSFRLDWRRDYIPLDIGFSLNNHSKDRFTTEGYPLVELLAAIGLTHARPKRLDKLKYRYGVLGVENADNLVSPCLLRAGLGCSPIPFPYRTFLMSLGWPGKENQARCITKVTEEALQ